MRKMRLITDEDFGLESKEYDNPIVRYAARGIVKNGDKIAILHKKNKNEYKLVGGGVEDNEEYEDAFRREAKEESGAIIKNISFLGIVEEHRSQDNFKQISYVYVADADKINKPEYTNKESDEGSEIEWLTLDDAIKAIKDCGNKLVPSKYENLYHSMFINKRDYEILKYYKKIIEQQ